MFSKIVNLFKKEDKSSSKLDESELNEELGWLEKKETRYHYLLDQIEAFTQKEKIEFYTWSILFFFLSRKTIPRSLILGALLGVGVFLWYLTYYYQLKFQWYKDLNKDLRNFTWLILTLPTALGFWVYRNNDKRKDHENAQKAQEQFQSSVRKEDLIRSLELTSSVIDQIAETTLSLRSHHGKSENFSLQSLIQDVDVSKKILEIDQKRVSIDQTAPYLKLKQYIQELNSITIDLSKLFDMHSVPYFYNSKHRNLIDHFGEVGEKKRKKHKEQIEAVKEILTPKDEQTFDSPDND